MEPISIFNLIYALARDDRYTPELWAKLLDDEKKRHPAVIGSDIVNPRARLASRDLMPGGLRPLKQVVAYWLRFGDLKTFAYESTEPADCFISTDAGLVINDTCDIDKEQLRTFLVSRKLPLPVLLFTAEPARRTDPMKVEISFILRAGTPATVADVWSELEKRCGMKGSCCLHVETDKDPVIVWRGANGAVKRLNKEALKKRLLVKGR